MDKVSFYSMMGQLQWFHGRRHGTYTEGVGKHREGHGDREGTPCMSLLDQTIPKTLCSSITSYVLHVKN